MLSILVGGPVNQSEFIFRHYLKCLRETCEYAQRKYDETYGEGLEIKYRFLLHDSPALSELLDKKEYIIWDAKSDFSIGDTHKWTANSIEQVRDMRNYMLTCQLYDPWDYLFMVDSDVLLRRETLWELLRADKAIVAEVFWTSWHTGQLPMPNAWDYDQYTFKPDSLVLWKRPGLYKVGMTGACTLINRSVVERDVTFDSIDNISFWGEDRSFCIRAACAGFNVWLDTHYPATHIYRDGDLEAWLCTVRS